MSRTPFHLLAIKPWLFLPTHLAYSISPFFLRLYSFLNKGEPCKWGSVSWRHLYFPNPLGTAGGVDKNALHVQDWFSLGAGFVEIGTCTPKRQKGNDKKILSRSLKYMSLWNNMGFPNKGIDFVEKKLLDLKKSMAAGNINPIFINIGKNKSTSISDAFSDYRKSMETLYPLADVFVINISSPNTPDLRTLFSKSALLGFLQSLKKVISDLDPKIPLILKLSPDEPDLLRVLEQSIQAGIDGWCLCNTTTKRSISRLFPQHGGISGGLLAPLSLNLLQQTTNYLKNQNIKNKLIISCGGVLTPQDVLHRLQMGADLVQVYSALVFTGPLFFRSVFQYMKINHPSFTN